MKLVRVTWFDAGFENSEMSVKDAKTLHPLRRVNVGLLVEQTDEKLIISFGQIEDCDKQATVYSDILVIPSAMVERMDAL